MNNLVLLVNKLQNKKLFLLIFILVYVIVIQKKGTYKYGNIRIWRWNANKRRRIFCNNYRTECSSNQLINLEINEKYRGLTTSTITFKEDYVTVLAKKRKALGILFIFKYLGDNKAIEILTKREVIMNEGKVSKFDTSIF